MSVAPGATHVGNICICTQNPLSLPTVCILCMAYTSWKPSQGSRVPAFSKSSVSESSWQVNQLMRHEIQTNANWPQVAPMANILIDPACDAVTSLRLKTSSCDMSSYGCWCFMGVSQIWMVFYGVPRCFNSNQMIWGSLHSRGNNHHEAPKGWLQQQQPSQLTTNNYRYTLKKPQIQRIYDCGAADVLLALIHSVGLKVTHTLLKVKVIPDWLCRNLACLSAPPSWFLSIEKRSSNIDSCGAGDFHLATFHFEDDNLTSWCPACSDPQAQGSQRAPESHFQHPTSWFFNIARWNWTSRQSWSIARRDSVRSNFSGEV